MQTFQFASKPHVQQSENVFFEFGGFVKSGSENSDLSQSVHTDKVLTAFNCL